MRCTPLSTAAERSLCVDDLLDYYLFKLIAGRERAAHCAVNLSLSQQKRSVLIETQVRLESFSALRPLGVGFCNCEVHQKLKSCTAPGRHDTPEEGKERHWEIHQK